MPSAHNAIEAMLLLCFCSTIIYFCNFKSHKLTVTYHRYQNINNCCQVRIIIHFGCAHEVYFIYLFQRIQISQLDRFIITARSQIFALRWKHDRVNALAMPLQCIYLSQRIQVLQLDHVMFVVWNKILPVCREHDRAHLIIMPLQNN
jgi:hypothetical protein